jgi:hypothetical protein
MLTGSPGLRAGEDIAIPARGGGGEEEGRAEMPTCGGGLSTALCLKEGRGL